VGGQQIPDSLALQYLNLYWSQSSYPNETALGLTDNKANVYCWSFSSDPVEAIASGRLLSSHQFSGQEQLLINFTASTSYAYQVDVFAFTESMLEVASNYVKKISL
jgi:hypothetical protein